MKLLLLDVETSPNLASVWGVFNQNIALNQLLETSRIMCYSAKWYGEDDIQFDSEHKSDHEDMILGLHGLMSDADAVIHYNGNRFDIPTVNREFLIYGIKPPEPFKNIDLFQTVKKRFRFVRSKLDHVCKELGIGSKIETGGHELWLECMNGDDEAWEKMEKYNKQDVKLLELLYEKLLPWITNHPNHALYVSSLTDPICPNCGSDGIIKKGIETTKTGKYQRFRCISCGTPLRGRFTLVDPDERDNILVQVNS